MDQDQGVSEFMKENWFMAVVTVVSIVFLAYFLTAQFSFPANGTPIAPKSLPDVPPLTSPGLQPVPASSVDDEEMYTVAPKSTGVSPARVLSVRPAKVGPPDMEAAREAAFAVVNAIPEIGGIPDSIKAGFSFYEVNPDGSRTDIPESDLSFTVQGGGLVRIGIGQGINVRVKIPASRLEDLQRDLCQAVKDMNDFDEVHLDLSGLSAIDRILLVTKGMPVAERCGLS